MYTWCMSYRMHATTPTHTHTHTHTHCKQSKRGNYTTPHARRQDNYTTPHAAPLSSRGSPPQSGRAEHTVIFYSLQVALSTLAPPACMQHPHCSDRREVPRCSGGVARKDSCTACERTAFSPCRRTHSAVDTRRRREEPTSAWPNRCQPVAHSALQPPRHPPPACAVTASIAFPGSITPEHREKG